MTRLVDELGLSLLAQVDTPAQLKQLSRKQLPQLAAEMRRFLLATLDETGGHFGANLGVVELSIALHYVFDSPTDAMVFDTGHQGYPHKILTGRRDDFASLRMLDGLSGFLRRDESEHDVWGAGHASTALPAALGLSAARGWDHPGWVVAVVGDGAMTGGVSLAGLNNSGLAKGRLLVILNDNGMSIAPNVGAMSRYLSHLKLRPGMHRLNRVLKRMSGGVPLLRQHGRNFYDKVKKALHYFWLPGAQGAVFDLLGFNYYGPFEGHDVGGLVDLFRMIKSWPPEQDGSPLLIHVRTEKGHGFAPAEADPYTWHAAKPRSIAPELERAERERLEKLRTQCAPLQASEEKDKLTGRAASKPASTKTYTAIFAEALIEQMRARPEIVAITAAMPDGTGLDKVGRVYPERTIDVGICEEFAVNFACGLAVEGKLPVCAIYSTFLQRAIDQLIHDVAIQNLPVVFALDRGGLAGADGETHQGIFDLSYLRMIPGFTVMAPMDENELRNMLFTALNHQGPVAFRFPRGNALGVAMDKQPRALPIGSWEVLRRSKAPRERAVAVLAVGHQVAEALKAADALVSATTEQGGPLDVTVVNARFIKPMDTVLLEALLQTHGALVTAEENVLAGGFGAGVLEWLEASGHLGDIKLVRVGIDDRFIQHGSQEELRARHGLDSAGIAAAIRRAQAGGAGLQPVDKDDDDPRARLQVVSG